jgi:hypothetical protein
MVAAASRATATSAMGSASPTGGVAAARVVGAGPSAWAGDCFMAGETVSVTTISQGPGGGEFAGQRAPGDAEWQGFRRPGMLSWRSG